MRHELKTDPRPFAAVWDGTKLYEIRKDDRKSTGMGVGMDIPHPYAVDDELLLRETRFSGEQMKGGRLLEYTGREVLCVVTHKLTGYGLQDGWCTLGIRRVELIHSHGPQRDARYKPEQPESFENVMPSSSASEIEFKYWDVKTRRDPAYVASEGSQYIGIKIADMPKDFDANKTATALAVAWDGEGMPYCFAHGRNTHVMDCRTCEVSLHARCSMETERRKKDVPVEVDRRIDAKQMSNKSGGHVSYYSVDVDNPSKGGAPYRAEAIDVIASLDMTFAEGEAFKAVWRCAADRCGAHKDGNDTRRDAEKVAYYGEQMTAREKKRHG